MAIQFMRGTSTQRKAATDVVPAAGQPFFETNTKKLYIGDGTTKLSSLYDICYDLNPYSLSVDGGAVISSDIWCYGNLNIDGSSSLGSTTMSSAYLPKVSFQRNNATVVNLLSPTSGGSTTTNIYLPAKAGTMALTSDIPTGALASKDSASGTLTIPSITYKVLSGISSESAGWGWVNINGKKSTTVNFSYSNRPSDDPLSNYSQSNWDYLYIEGVDTSPTSGGTSDSDCAHIFIPVNLWKVYTGNAHTISLTRDGARARIYYTGDYSIGVHTQAYINYIRVWGIKRNTSTITVS